MSLATDAIIKVLAEIWSAAVVLVAAVWNVLSNDHHVRKLVLVYVYNMYIYIKG